MSVKIEGNTSIPSEQYKDTVDIVIPTYNNHKQLTDTIKSLERNTTSLRSITIVNNGDTGLRDSLPGSYSLIEENKNLGWMKGINEGAKIGSGEYILMLNDDVIIIPGHYDWLDKMIEIMRKDPTVGEVGPSSNVVSGAQNIWNVDFPPIVEVPYIIGFCKLIRRDVFDKIGGLDGDLPGADDFDLAIRLKDLGYKSIARRDVFVYHIGFQTGERLYGNPKEKGGWNSKEMINENEIAIIRKHGVKKFHRTFYGTPMMYVPKDQVFIEEDQILKPICKGKGLDIGCGQKKVVESAIGVDLIAKGKKGTTGSQVDKLSEADIQANADNLPFEDEEMDYIVASHLLEHTLDTMKTLKEWYRVLKKKGKLGIIVPNSEYGRTKQLDPSHRHDFTISSLTTLVELAGFKIKESGNSSNQYSIFIKAIK